ncbi:MAG TPA: BON domain-containing protein [Puia sp.]|nr:BON domain-containing protein [Puia sp.]
MNKRPLSWAALLLGILFMSATLVSCGVKDSTIQEEIADAAKATPELATVNSTVKDGVVTLSGEVKDDASKAASEAAVRALKGVKSVANNITIAPPPPAPAPVVTVNPDDELKKGVTDATKDFPTVKADVTDGVITLTGDIKRSSLQKLMESLHSLKPKRIDNSKLTIK